MSHAERVDGLIEDLHPLFRALGEPLRLALVRCLLAADDGMSVAALMAAVDAPQSTVSRHLGILRDTGVVAAQRDGTARIYRVTIDDATVDSLESLVTTIRACRADGH